MTRWQQAYETPDQKLIRERRKQDQRNYLIRALDEEVAPRLAPALNAARDLMLRNWCGHAAVVATMLRASDIAVNTAKNQLYNAVAAELVEVRGKYSKYQVNGKWRGKDTREYRVIDWPTVTE